MHLTFDSTLFQKYFASFLGLDPVVPAQEVNIEEETDLERSHNPVSIFHEPVSQVMATLPPSRQRRSKRIVQSQNLCGSKFLEDHPFLSITSAHAFLNKFWKITKPSTISLLSHEKYCGFKSTEEPICNPKIVNKKNKTTKGDTYTHKYSFSANDRASHDVELITGKFKKQNS